MARFYGGVTGKGGREVTRTGTRTDGMKAFVESRIQGWNLGAKLIIKEDDDGEDLIEVRMNGGSSEWGTGHGVLVGYMKRDKENGKVRFISNGTGVY